MTAITKLLGTSALALALIAMPASAQEDDKKWDVNNPPGKSRNININVTEGTWMSLDVSPDGQTIAFDLLGDIYTMPITGGTAKNISSGMAWEMQPRFSPDGRKIAFTSDRAGGDNIWVMDANGENKKEVTKETFRLLNNPTWSPDGRFIAARKHFTTSRSLGTGEIWLYHVDGGSGIQLTEKPSEAHQKEIGEPIFSADGRYIYFTANTTSGPIFEYAQDSNTALFDIKRYDMETGETITAVRHEGGAVRPTPSPDGRSIAYVRRDRAKSKLYIMDLDSGKTRKIYDALDQDMQETWAVHGVYPNMDFTPDGQHLIFWAGGKIRKLNIESGDVETIEFRVRDSRKIQDPPRPKIDVAPDSFSTEMVRFSVVSPDGKTAVFESLGKLYKKSLPGGRAERLTTLPDNQFELFPAFSRDGKQLAFTTWNDQELGALHTMNMADGSIKTLTTSPGHYARPQFSPKGGAIVYERQRGGNIISPYYSNDPGIYRVSTRTGKITKVTDSGENPHFGADGKRIYMTTTEGGNRALVSVNPNGTDQRSHASSKLAQSFFMSPDGSHIAFRENYNLFVLPVFGTGASISTGPGSNTVPTTKLSVNGSTWPQWSPDGSRIYWTLGPTLFEADIEKLGESYSPPTKGISLARTVNKAVPDGRIALIGATIITMNGEDGGVIENGKILINGDRIEAIGEDVRIPSGVTEVDMSGKTIMPGIIDAHAHGPQGSDELIPQQNYDAQAHLALGVTTIHDPSSRASEIFAASEMQRAGVILAPRIFSTGEVIYGAKAPGFFANIQSAEDAQEHVSRLAAQGAASVKNYNQPRRDQRQQVVAAAREENIAVVAEGGSLYHMDMSMVADGNTSIEHNLPQAEIYDDVIQMFGQSQVAYTPTLAVTYGGVRGEDYYYQESNVWEHPILSRHVPPRQLQARAVRRQMAPVEDYADDDSAATSKKLMEAGVLVSIGAHGQREGLAAHWEMWSFARGGMSPVQVLKTATVNPAKFLGYWDDIGSLEEGKLADLVILSDNPLTNIRNTDKVEYVMIGGRLYESGTLNEVHTGDRQRQPYWWETE